MKVYAAKNKDLNIRLNSSSGGIFTALAEQIINEGGTVIGATLDNLEVKHIAIDNVNDIKKLQGSKYVQSTVDYSLLNNKKPILFSGTPCQMPNDDVLKIDVVCHGTPTKESFKKYCNANQISHIKFRDKTNGWTNFMVVTCKDGNTIHEDFRNNEFMMDFLNNKNLKESCYNCQFKNFKSSSDITLGDFWGIQNEYPDFADNIGVSLVIVKTPRGEEYFDKIKDKLDYIEIDIDKAIKYNPSIIKSAVRG